MSQLAGQRRYGVYLTFVARGALSARRARHARADAKQPETYAHLDEVEHNLSAVTAEAGLRIGNLLARNGFDCEVSFDERSDLERVLQVFRAQVSVAQKMAADHSGARPLHQQFRAAQATADYAKAATRIAGVFAGDIRAFFRIHGDRIWTRLDEPIHIAETPLQNRRSLSRIAERLACREFRTGSRDTCLLQGYTGGIIDRRIGFTSPSGIRGEIEIAHGNQWGLHQASDFPAYPTSGPRQ